MIKIKDNNEFNALNKSFKDSLNIVNELSEDLKHPITEDTKNKDICIFSMIGIKCKYFDDFLKEHKFEFKAEPINEKENFVFAVVDGVEYRDSNWCVMKIREILMDYMDDLHLAILDYMDNEDVSIEDRLNIILGGKKL